MVFHSTIMFNTKPRAPNWPLLYLSGVLAQLAAFAVEYDALQAVAALSSIELSQRIAPLGLIVDIGQHMQGLFRHGQFPQ